MLDFLTMLNWELTLPPVYFKDRQSLHLASEPVTFHTLLPPRNKSVFTYASSNQTPGTRTINPSKTSHTLAHILVMPDFYGPDRLSLPNLAKCIITLLHAMKVYQRIL
jgi:hypothetical protein